MNNALRPMRVLFALAIVMLIAARCIDAVVVICHDI